MTQVLVRKKKFNLKKLLLIIFLVYILVGAALYFLQDKFLFHPTPLPPGYTFAFKDSFTEQQLYYDNNTSFNIVKFKVPEHVTKKGVVIYFHGNMDNITHYATFAPYFTKNGYEIWMMDYPGYGKSTGELNEKILYTEALEVYKMARGTGYTPDSIIIYGKSLGTGIAAQLASVRDCKKLILECPYYSIENLASHYGWMYPVSWFMNYKIPTNEYLQKVAAPITIFHGTNDGTIPFSNSEKLKSSCLKPGDELIAVEGADHNNLYDYDLVKKSIDSLLQQ
ncbi:MAG TPA: alpha/beta hydrolase [Panacibacter sp.]|nr:alpha/beta hydrolase [Panacibacter sp.]